MGSGGIAGAGAKLSAAEDVGASPIGHSDSMGSGGISGAGSHLGAAEDLTPRRSPPSNKPADWATMTPDQRRRWQRSEKKATRGD